MSPRRRRILSYLAMFLSIDVLIQSSDCLLLHHFLRHGCSDPRNRQRTAVDFGANQPCEKPCGACRDANKHCDAPVGRALPCVWEFRAALLLR